MSSINQHPTFSYLQPREYQFSHDSVFFARWAAEIIELPANAEVLDLCCGCGIIGLDYLYHLDELKKELPLGLAFLDVQEVYQSSLEANLKTLRDLKPKLQQVNTVLHIQNYDQPLAQKFDLILSNPPYFFKDYGTLSKSEFKNRCRFFLDSTFEKFLNFLVLHLKASGCAYFLMRNQTQHGVDLEKIFLNFVDHCHIVKVTEIRGTSVYKVTRA